MTIRTLLAAWVLALTSGLAGAQSLTIGNYTLVSSRRVSVTDFEYVFRAQVTNTGPALRNVVGTVVSNNPATVVLEGTLSFGDVAAGATVTSVDTATFRHNRSQPFDPTTLVWSFSSTPGAIAIESRFDTLPSAGGPAPHAVRFTPRPFTTTTIIRYEWMINGALVRVSATPDDLNWTFSSPGAYSASLTVQDTEGRRHTASQSIQVSPGVPASVAPAYVSPNNGAGPLATRVFFAPADAQNVVGIQIAAPGATPASWTYIRPAGAALPASSPVLTYPQSPFSTATYQASVTYVYASGSPIVVSGERLTVSVNPQDVPTVAVETRQLSTAFPVTLEFTLLVPSNPDVQHRLNLDEIVGGGCQPVEYPNPETRPRNSLQCVYAAPGIHSPTLYFTLLDANVGFPSGSVTTTVEIRSAPSIALSTDSIDAQLGGSVSIGTSLPAAARVSLVVETLAGTAVRTLLPMTSRNDGSYTDTWDGRDAAGQYVPEGVYKIVLLRESGASIVRVDTSATTGGQRFFPRRNALDSRFYAAGGRPMVADFTLDTAAEVTAFMGTYFVDTRYYTFFSRKPFAKGTHRITWNGENVDGQLIGLPPGDVSNPYIGSGSEAFLLGVMAHTLPENAIFVRNGIQLTALRASPTVFDPTGLTSAGAPNSSSIQFNLSLPGTAEMTVQDTITGAVVQRLQFRNLSAGANTIVWDGKVSDGRYAAPGTYRLGVSGYLSNGNRSMVSYVLQQVYY